MTDSAEITQKPLARLHAVVSGRVQGVNFRMFVQETASRLALTGWVRNLYTGEVEVVAEGRRADLENLLVALHRGPRSAYVTEVKNHWLSASGEFTTFQVRRTA